MKTLLAFCWLLFFPSFAHAAADFKPVSGEEAKRVLTSIDAARAACRSRRATFVQTKTMAFMEEELRSNGLLYFRQPDCLRWEYTQPVRFVFVLNGEKMYTDSEGNRTETDIRQNASFRQMSRLMLFGLSGASVLAQEDYDWTLDADGRQYRLSLYPKNKALKRFFPRIDLFFGMADYEVEAITLTEKSGDQTRIVFTSQQVNQDVDPGVFEF